MMKKRAICCAALALGMAVTMSGALARAKPEKDRLQQGAEDYRTYCAACHGVNAHGQGPVAPFLVRKPPDLTLLAAGNGGEFPVDRAYFVIDGRGDVAAHGTREMPVWGERFGGPGVTERQKRERILNIIAYLKRLQRPANPVPR